MKAEPLILADSSAWIDFFRSGKSGQAQKLAEYLDQDRVCVAPVIRAEILSGARTESEYDRLKDGLSALPMLEDFPRFWDSVAHARFRLARKGVQASITDLMIAVCASHYGCRLLTLDKEFRQISTVVPVQIEQ